MKKYGLILPCALLGLSSCGINETFQSMEANRQAVDTSTYTVYENIENIERANRGIEENIQQVEAINKSLREAQHG